MLITNENMTKRRMYFILLGIVIFISVVLILLKKYEELTLIVVIATLITIIFEGMARSNREQATIHYKISNEIIQSNIKRIEDFNSNFLKIGTKFYDSLSPPFVPLCVFLPTAKIKSFDYEQIEQEYPDFKKNTSKCNEQLKNLEKGYDKITLKIEKLYSKLSEEYERFMSDFPEELFFIVIIENFERVDRDDKEKVQDLIEKLRNTEFQNEIENIRKKIKLYENEEKKFLELLKKHLKKLQKLYEKWQREYEPYGYL